MPFTRRNFARGSLVSAVLAPGVLVPGAWAQGARTVRLTFVHTNDFYKMSEESGRGGLARFAAIVRAERARNPNTFVSHAGDTLSPSLMSGFDQGEHMVDMFNALGLDFFAPGNHEFDFGPEVYRKRMAQARFAVLAANMREANGSRLPSHRDTMIVEREGVKIGVVGAILESTPTLSSPGPVQFSPLVESVRKNAGELRQQGADIVIALVHCDKPTGQRLFASRAVDLILMGHSHDLQIDYDGRVALVESSQDGLLTVVTDVAVTIGAENGERRISWRAHFRVIDSADVAPDPAMRTMVAGYEADLSKELDVAVATLAAPFESTTGLVRTGETAIGNFFADALRAQNDAEASILNGGGIRGNKRYPVGHTLTRRDILTEMPFGNKSVVTRVTGKVLREAIENGLATVDAPSGRFPQTSGLEIVANRSAPAGSRVVSINVNGAPLDPDRVYRVAVLDFMLRGGDGYGALRDPTASDDTGDRLIANDIMVYARKMGSIAAKVEGRLVFR